MKNWKTKRFGDNAMNFHGWLAAGLVVIGASIYCVKRALDADDYRSLVVMMLASIWFLLLGIFGVLWHNYIARVAEKLDAPKTDQSLDPPAS
jgi:hypothetical protein